MFRNAWKIAAVVALALVLAACSSSDDESTETTAAAASEAESGGDGGAVVVRSVTITVSDGFESTLDVIDCDAPDESSVTLNAESESGNLTVSATGMAGTLLLEGATEIDGTIDSVIVSDVGDVTASGTTADGATFDLTATCG
jgi:hypothetical protein